MIQIILRRVMLGTWSRCSREGNNARPNSIPHSATDAFCVAIAFSSLVNTRLHRLLGFWEALPNLLLSQKSVPQKKSLRTRLNA